MKQRLFAEGAWVVAVPWLFIILLLTLPLWISEVASYRFFKPEPDIRHLPIYTQAYDMHQSVNPADPTAQHIGFQVDADQELILRFYDKWLQKYQWEEEGCSFCPYDYHASTFYWPTKARPKYRLSLSLAVQDSPDYNAGGLSAQPDAAKPQTYEVQLILCPSGVEP